MQQDGMILADAVTFVCLLQPCSSLAGLEKGKEVHDQILETGLDKTNVFVVNSLVDMYSKCGSMDDAQRVFDAALTRDIVTWNALITGYARQGKSGLVFHHFQRMGQEGMQPNSITFLGIFTACSHVGSVDDGKKVFEAMSKDYSVTPENEHYNCMVDLSGCAGQLDSAVEMLLKMPFQPRVEVWRTVLGACQKWSDVDVGRHAFDCAVRLDEKDAGAYIVMSNIYEAAQMWQEAKEIQEIRVKVGARKKPGQSWLTDLGESMPTFAVGNGTNPQT